jgi:predicted MFS family arabinose efflux permease
MARAVVAFGWRETMQGLAALSAVIAVLLWVFIKNPPHEETHQRGSVLDLLKMPQLWPLFALVFVNYAPAAGLRGLWAGPYVADVYAADSALIGRVTLIMGIAMITASFAYGPLERLFKTRKWVVVAGNGASTLALLVLFMVPAPGIWISTALLAIIGFGGSTFPLLVAHGKAFLPAHLTGRGVTLINLFGIGGVGVAQFITAPLHSYGGRVSETAAGPYALIFLYFAGASLCGLLAYLFVQDRTD